MNDTFEIIGLLIIRAFTRIYLTLKLGKLLFKRLLQAFKGIEYPKPLATPEKPRIEAPRASSSGIENRTNHVEAMMAGRVMVEKPSKQTKLYAFNDYEDFANSVGYIDKGQLPKVAKQHVYTLGELQDLLAKGLDPRKGKPK